MSSVLFRSESPYVPRAIERTEGRVPSVDAGSEALRVLIVSATQRGTQGEDSVVGLANSLCDSGHIVDLIAESRAPALDGRIRLIKLQETFRPKRNGRFGQLFGAISKRAKAERKLAVCLSNIISERDGDYDLVIDDQTLLDQVFAFRARGLKVLCLIREPQAIERSARKTVRSFDGVLAPSHATADEIARILGMQRTTIEVVNGASIASAVSRLYARADARRS